MAAAAAADALAAAAAELLLELLLEDDPCPAGEEDEEPGIFPVVNACIAASSDGKAPCERVSKIFRLSRSNFSSACLFAC